MRIHSTRKIIIPVGPSIAYVPLTKEQFALVDSWHAPALEIFNWHASYSPSRREYRAASSVKITKTKVYRIPLHRAIAGIESYAIDHKNGNPLDNRECNLRACTSAENNRNRRKVINKTGYKGISKYGNRFTVLVNAPLAIEKRTKYLGSYPTAEDAARAYDRWAIANYGEFASTNFPRHSYAPDITVTAGRPNPA